ncbi:MAG: type II toxin-antitoxin system RelB/DinJ family antitoxin [Oscillospiraceae bacterium]|nr:type II toxin-antitoxin system RelB/DinJ family antitoxin [Oscillospiraceae bacterium]
MHESRLSVRVDDDVKKRAESVFRALGMTMSAGINLYLNQVALQQGIPFALTQVPQKADNEIELQRKLEQVRAQTVVEAKLKAMHGHGAPIALYDEQKKEPFMLYPDGRQVYSLE